MTLRRIITMHTAPMLAALLLAGFGTGALAQSSASGAAAAKSGTKDAAFMRHAAADSLAEIQMGHIALDQSSSAQVKAMARRIIDDHTKANDQLKDIAQRKQVTLPTEPMPMQKQEADKLKAMKGSAFDEAYARAMVKDHRKAIKAFGMESQKAGDADLKQFASTTLPVLKTHLQMAEQIAGGGMRGHQGSSGRNSMNHADGTPMEHNGTMGAPASGSSTH